jgi:hypothetical protein
MFADHCYEHVNSNTQVQRQSTLHRDFFFFHGATAPRGPRPPHFSGFTITLRHTTLGRTPLDEWSARRTDLYLTTHNTHNRQTSMPPAGIKPTIPASERPQTHASDRVATGIGSGNITNVNIEQIWALTALCIHVRRSLHRNIKHTVISRRYDMKSRQINRGISN